jgi:hypothetical protein
MPGQRRTVFEVSYAAGGDRRRELWWIRRWADARAEELAAAGIPVRLRTTRMETAPACGSVMFRRLGERRRHA